MSFIYGGERDFKIIRNNMIRNKLFLPSNIPLKTIIIIIIIIPLGKSIHLETFFFKKKLKIFYLNFFSKT